MMNRISRTLLASMLIAGCSTVILSPDMARVKDKSSAWQEGYRAGCHSGFVAGGSLVHSFQRDTERTLKEEEYKGGWKQGYRECKDDFREMCKSEAMMSKADLYCSDVRQQGLHKEE